MKLFMLSFCLLFLQQIHAQVTGRLVTVAGQGLPDANVLLYKAVDSTLVKAAVTDRDGRFSIIAPPGRYLLQCGSIGYLTWHSAVFDFTDSKEMGRLLMDERPRQLGGIEIISEQPLFRQQPGGLTVNVQNSVLTKGSSVLEVLERLPGVVVDQHNSGITLNTRPGVMVMINGKLQRMQFAQLLAYLNGLRGDDVEKIELLDTPPAKYDAEGSGGLINIVLKRNKRPGINGNTSISAGYGTGEKASLNAALSYNRQMADLYGSYSYARNRSYNRYDVTGFHDIPIMAPHTAFIFQTTHKPLQQDHNATLGIDLRPSAKFSTGGSMQFSANRSIGTTASHGDYVLPPDSILTVTTAVQTSSRWRNVALAAYADRQLLHGGQLGFSADYLYYRNRNPSAMQNAYLNEYGQPALLANDSFYAPQHRSQVNTRIQIGVLALQYTQPITQHLKIETGIKGTFSGSHSRSGINSLVNGEWRKRAVTSEYHMREGIGAAYATGTIVINPKNNLVIGGRYEYVHGDVTSPGAKQPVLKRRQGLFFPNLSYSYKASETADWQASYSKRISRPSYNDLASYVSYNDPVSVFTGNPQLRPAINHQLRVGFNTRGYAFSINASHISDAIVYSQIGYGPDKTLAYFSPRNLDYQQQLGLQANLPFNPLAWWSMTYNLAANINRLSVPYTEVPVKKTYPFASISFTETFRLPYGFTTELSGRYASKHYYGSIEVRGLSILSLGVKKDLWKGTFNLVVTDVLRINRNNSLFGKLTREAFGLDTDVLIYPEHTVATVAKLTYSRNFGTGERARKEGAGDERSRVRRD
ncbi:outer membrane beta-barrel family protein [uncultured Chitinophaga sp.]|uniref:outer membrane beta-barrel family protein n=1 Tax=uncultured Chitinophaga sp. TaxID=339340 RepID=UPI0025F38A40|nr:outer membrane beta-barrel family protein [uncultured Chitinophaga sp.]